MLAALAQRAEPEDVCSLAVSQGTRGLGARFSKFIAAPPLLKKKNPMFWGNKRAFFCEPGTHRQQMDGGPGQLSQPDSGANRQPEPGRGLESQGQ